MWGCDGLTPEKNEREMQGHRHTELKNGNVMRRVFLKSFDDSCCKCGLLSCFLLIYWGLDLL